MKEKRFEVFNLDYPCGVSAQEHWTHPFPIHAK